MNFVIPEAELQYRASPPGGPGGQHANKTSTRIDVLWDVRGSPSLTDAQRLLLLERLRSRIDRAGLLRVRAGSRRSVTQNREEAIDRLHRLVNDALQVPTVRRQTRVPRAAREARLAEKRRRAERKRRRGPVTSDE